MTSATSESICARVRAASTASALSARMRPMNPCGLEAAESLEQLFVGGVDFERVKPRFPRISSFLLLHIDITQMLVDHGIIADERYGPFNLRERFGQHA